MKSLIEQYREMHESPKVFCGFTTKFVVRQVEELIFETGAKTILDYGSGKGLQYRDRQVHLQWGGILPHCYDPGVIEFSVKPTNRFDGVICCDVLEHIPEEDIPTTLKEIFEFAEKFVVLAIFTGPARKILPDGRNAHVTQKPPSWWNEKIDQANLFGVPVKSQFRAGEEK